MKIQMEGRDMEAPSIFDDRVGAVVVINLNEFGFHDEMYYKTWG